MSGVVVKVQASGPERDEGTGYWDSSWSCYHHARYVPDNLHLCVTY